MFRRSHRWLAGLVLTALGLSQVELTPLGVHVGLRLVLPQGDLRLFSFAGTGDAPALPASSTARGCDWQADGGGLPNLLPSASG